MNVSMSMTARTFTASGPVTVLMAILIVRVAPYLASEICNRVLQAVQLMAKHIKLVPAKGHIVAAWRAILTIILSHDGSRLVAVDILPLVGRMI